MPRYTRERVYKIRRRRPGKKFSTSLALGGKSNGKQEGRILLKRKVGYEELYKVGDRNPFIVNLRKEIGEIQGNKVGG